MVVLSTAVSVIPATVVNNMSSKQQIRTYWGLAQFRDATLCACGKQNNKFETNLSGTESDGPILATNKRNHIDLMHTTKKATGVAAMAAHWPYF